MARGRPSKKQFILDIAQQLFSERGYQGTSIDLVVRLSKVSKPTVYNNFPSKQVLLETLIEAQLVSAKDRHQQLLEAPTDTSKMLYQVFQSTIDSEFEVAIFRILYAERYKLEETCLKLCQQLDEIIEHTVIQILAPLSISLEQQLTTLAICKNALLIEHLQGKKVASYSELKAQLTVLNWIQD